MFAFSRTGVPILLRVSMGLVIFLIKYRIKPILYHYIFFHTIPLLYFLIVPSFEDI